jgi:hypothetical protein
VAEEGLRALGAHEVYTDPVQVDRPVSAVPDDVGGRQLVDAFAAARALLDRRLHGKAVLDVV